MVAVASLKRSRLIHVARMLILASRLRQILALRFFCASVSA